MRNFYNIFFFICLCLGAALSSHQVFSAEQAMTNSGKVVILKDDGTWSYQNLEDVDDFEKPLEVNSGVFNKPETSDFLLKSKVNDSAFWFNSKKWKISSEANNEDAEYSVEYRDGDVYGLMLTEGVEIIDKDFIKIAHENILKIDPNAKVIEKEYRMVNGNKVIYMRNDFLFSGIKASYLGYYFSNSKGSTQFIAYTSTNLVDKYKAEIDNFLNGFVLAE